MLACVITMVEHGWNLKLPISRGYTIPFITSPALEARCPAGLAPNFRNISKTVALLESNLRTVCFVSSTRWRIKGQLWRSFSYDKWKHAIKDEHWVLVVREKNAANGLWYDWTSQGSQSSSGHGLTIKSNKRVDEYAQPPVKLKEDMGEIRQEQGPIVHRAATSVKGGNSSRAYIIRLVELLVNEHVVDAQHLYALRRTYDKVKFDRSEDSMKHQEEASKWWQQRNQADAEPAIANARQVLYNVNVHSATDIPTEISSGPFSVGRYESLKPSCRRMGPS